MATAATTYTMLGNETLWEAAKAAHEALAGVGVAHGVMGGVAVCLHGYRRNTVDVDLVIRRDDAETAKAALLAAGFAWDDDRREASSPAGVAVQFLFAGTSAGKSSEVQVPDPADNKAITVLEDLPVLTLARLIESKLACGAGSPRRTHKDFADVVELIATNNLGRDFARYLHKSLRATFRELALRARGE